VEELSRLSTVDVSVFTFIAAFEIPLWSIFRVPYYGLWCTLFLPFIAFLTDENDCNMIFNHILACFELFFIEI